MASNIGGVTFYRDGGDWNMVIKQGKTLEFTYIWGGNSPIDVTGFTAHFQARDSDDNVLLDATIANSRISIGGVNGEIGFLVTAADSADLSGSGNYALELTTASGKVYEPLTGSFTVRDEFVK